MSKSPNVEEPTTKESRWRCRVYLFGLEEPLFTDWDDWNPTQTRARVIASNPALVVNSIEFEEEAT